MGARNPFRSAWRGHDFPGTRSQGKSIGYCLSAMFRPIYLDHNATTPVDPAVLEAMLPWLGERWGNRQAATVRAGSTAPWTMPVSGGGGSGAIHGNRLYQWRVGAKRTISS